MELGLAARGACCARCGRVHGRLQQCTTRQHGARALALVVKWLLLLLLMHMMLLLLVVKMIVMLTAEMCLILLLLLLLLMLMVMMMIVVVVRGRRCQQGHVCVLVVVVGLHRVVDRTGHVAVAVAAVRLVVFVVVVVLVVVIVIVQSGEEVIALRAVYEAVRFGQLLF